jgi:YbgC/YbaW family acyl-CoA thioester hydrolase
MSAPGSPVSEFTLRRRVYFYECDGAGIVHFSNYFRYMEEAEHGLWRATGLSIANRTSGVGFPRVAASFEYHRPLRFEDEVDITVRIASISTRSMKYICTITRAGEPIATGSAAIVCVAYSADKSMKAVPIPPEIASKFAVAAGAAS